MDNSSSRSNPCSDCGYNNLCASPDIREHLDMRLLNSQTFTDSEGLGEYGNVSCRTFSRVGLVELILHSIDITIMVLDYIFGDYPLIMFNFTGLMISSLGAVLALQLYKAGNGNLLNIERRVIATFWVFYSIYEIFSTMLTYLVYFYWILSYEEFDALTWPLILKTCFELFSSLLRIFFVYFICNQKRKLVV